MMSNEVILGGVVAMIVAVVLGFKGWGYRALKYKMDESAILNYLAESSSDIEFRSTEAISAGTDIRVERVVFVCATSKSIRRDAQHEESWCIK